MPVQTHDRRPGPLATRWDAPDQTAFARLGRVVLEDTRAITRGITLKKSLIHIAPARQLGAKDAELYCRNFRSVKQLEALHHVALMVPYVTAMAADPTPNNGVSRP